MNDVVYNHIRIISIVLQNGKNLMFMGNKQGTRPCIETGVFEKMNQTVFILCTRIYVKKCEMRV